MSGIVLAFVGGSYGGGGGLVVDDGAFSGAPFMGLSFGG